MPFPVAVPFPLTLTVSVSSEPENVALTLTSEFIVTVHDADVPVHAPPQPANVDPWPGFSPSVTCVPAG